MPQELEPFDARAYLEAGDWQSALVKKGWHQAPGDIQSVRKDYFSPLGWRIHLWVERETKLAIATEDTIIIAFGPNGTKLGSMWVGYDDALGDVDRLERLIELDRPYEVVADNVARFLGSKLSEAGEFDPRAYMADDFSELMLTFGYKHVAERSYVKPYHTPLVDFKVYYDGVAEEKRFLSPGEGRHRGQAGGIMVEARLTQAGVERNPDLPRWMQDWTRQNYRSLLSHAFDHDPPLDIVKQVDDTLTNWTGTIDEAEVAMTHLKGRLRTMSNQFFKARKRVESLVNKLLDSEEPFDARQYMMDAPSIELLADELERNHWQLTEREGKFGWKFRRLDADVNGVTCDLYLYVLPEPPFESHIELFAVWRDANGFEHRVRVPQRAWWELESGESVADYVARIIDGMARKLKAPQHFQQ